MFFSCGNARLVMIFFKAWLVGRRRHTFWSLAPALGPHHNKRPDMPAPSAIHGGQLDTECRHFGMILRFRSNLCEKKSSCPHVAKGIGCVGNIRKSGQTVPLKQVSITSSPRGKGRPWYLIETGITVWWVAFYSLLFQEQKQTPENSRNLGPKNQWSTIAALGRRARAMNRAPLFRSYFLSVHTSAMKCSQPTVNDVKDGYHAICPAVAGRFIPSRWSDV